MDPPPPDPVTARTRRIAMLAYYYLALVAFTAVLYATPGYWAQRYHNSKMSGMDWVQELLLGHPDRIHTELGMRVHVFTAFVFELRVCGLSDSRYVTLEEKVAIFLYSCTTGLSIRHVGERFQRSNETISRYFREVLEAVSSAPFYTRFVVLPKAGDLQSARLEDNPKFWPFFKDVIGAIDGTHIHCCPSAEERQAAQNRKGFLSQNCLACCSLDLVFQYFVSGHEGSTGDAFMYDRARRIDFPVPPGKYYLADAGFTHCNALIVPYRGIRYHLAEWGRAGVRPVNREELFNLRHASARNVVECIFGVIKARWEILVHAPHYDMSIQVRIPPGLAAVHNFIMTNDDTDIHNFNAAWDPAPGYDGAGDTDIHGDLAEGLVSNEEKTEAERRRDDIAQAMWDSYIQLLAERAIDGLE